MEILINFEWKVLFIFFSFIVLLQYHRSYTENGEIKFAERVKLETNCF